MAGAAASASADTAKQCARVDLMFMCEALMKATACQGCRLLIEARPTSRMSHDYRHWTSPNP
ncbi:hypothetical protein H096_05147 [Pseudomonas sp. FH1]|nr:hypothetical protein H096_05147 [Pseudomonas sp. FH1]